MRIIERSWLYISRKKGKTTIMFCVLFVMATAMISTISIKSAANVTMRQARERLGGSFSVYINYDESNPNIKRQVAQEEENSGGGISISSIQLINEGPPLTQAIADQIKQVAGISYANGSAVLVLENHGIIPIEQQHTGTQMTGSNDLPSLILNVNSDATYDSLFQKHTMKLVEGAFVGAQDKQKIMIHKSLAEKNNLQLHDQIPLMLGQQVSEKKGIDKKEVMMEIVGIFDTATSPNQDAMAFLLPENTIITNALTASSLTQDKQFEFDQMMFGVDDPKNLPTILEQVKKLDIDWNQFLIDTHDQEYQQMAGLIENLDGIMTFMLYAVCIVACIILALILSLWIKGRIQETGILLSIGIQKWNIVTQYILELCMIAVFAFGLSYASGSAITQSMSDTLIAQLLAQEQSQGVITSSVSISNVDGALETIEELKVSVNGNDVMLVYLIGGMIIIVAVMISSITILRLKPKEILSKMS